MTLPIRPVSLRTTFCAALLLGAPLLAQAQYKVIGADGKVTYTDRAPSTTEGKVTSLNARPGVVVDVALPIELRQAASRYPVTLYVSVGACEPCDSARQLLRQRGVPYTEKQIVSAEDSDALDRLTGGRDVPTLSIGSQTLRGLAPEVWASYLDAAAYPRESRLPSSYQYAAASPLTERREARPATPPAAARAAASAAEVAAPPPNPASGAIKF